MRKRSASYPVRGTRCSSRPPRQAPRVPPPHRRPTLHGMPINLEPMAQEGGMAGRGSPRSPKKHNGPVGQSLILLDSGRSARPCLQRPGLNTPGGAAPTMQ